MENTYSFLLYMAIVNMNHYFSIIKPFLLLFLKLFNIHMYRINNKEKIILINSDIGKCICSDYSNDNPNGIIIPRHLKYLVIATHGTQSNSIYIFTSKKNMDFFNKHEKKHKIEKIYTNVIEKKDNTISYWDRNGDYNYFEYTKRNIYINDFSFTTEQRQIYENIMEIYNNKNNVKCFIYGKPGSGKTFISYLMARELNCYLCDSFNPTQPSDYLSNLYNRVSPNAKKPLILLLDEIDVLIHNIHYEKIAPHKNNTIQVFNKMTWNHFIDKIDYGMFPNLILILCSNITSREINRIDPCYLREGRIDLIQNLIRE